MSHERTDVVRILRENYVRMNQLHLLKSSGCWVEQTMLDIYMVNYQATWTLRWTDSMIQVTRPHSSKVFMTLPKNIDWKGQRWHTVGDSEPFIQARVLIWGFPVYLSNVPHLPMISGTDKLKPPLEIVTNEISWHFKCNMFSKDKQHIF